MRAESTERRAVIIGSPRFASKPRKPHHSFVSAKLRRYAEPNRQVKRKKKKKKREAGCSFALHKEEGKKPPITL